MAVKITVIVCTRNRAASLRRTLASLLQQSLPSYEYEVVVVDNASADNTRALVEQTQDGTVSLRYCHEQRLGLSFARNHGLAEARTPLVAFIDDDAEADASWLESLAAAFAAESRRPLSVGGKVVPIWDVPRPAWLPRASLSVLSILDNGPRTHACAFPRETIIGCNIAFETSFLIDSGGFDPLLGRRGESLTSNEEIKKLKEVQDRGGLILYEPAAVVRHFIPRDRLTLGWFLRRTYAQGVSDVILDQTSRNQTPADRQSASRLRRLRGYVHTWRRLQDHVRRLKVAEQPKLPQTTFLCLTAIAYELGRASRRLAPM